MCESDNDEQLLMTFEFRESVRLHSINIVAPSGGAAPLNATSNDSSYLQFRWCLRLFETVSGEDDRKCSGKPRTV